VKILRRETFGNLISVNHNVFLSVLSTYNVRRCSIFSKGEADSETYEIKARQILNLLDIVIGLIRLA
jgi:hypothetical protein